MYIAVLVSLVLTFILNGLIKCCTCIVNGYIRYYVIMVSGQRKKSKTHFKHGNKAWQSRKACPPGGENSVKNIIRLTDAEAEQILDHTPDGLVQICDSDGQSVPGMILRPRPCKPDDHDNGDNNKIHCDNYAILQWSKVADLWNHAYMSHQRESPDCMAEFMWDEYEKWGLCWAASVKCKSCNYKTKCHPLFEQIDTGNRGRKAAKLNLAVQVALHRHAISYTGLCDILNSLNIMAPTISSMQKCADKVGKAIVNENKRDMNEKIENIQKLKEKCGLGYDVPINCEGDGTFNNRLGSASNPFQSGTQCTYSVVENFTKSKHIISMATKNKLCHCKGEVHGDNCTANLAASDTIGNEGEYLRECISDINEAGLSVRHVTLDGDSNATKEAEEILQPSNIDLDVLSCTRHLSNSLRKAVKNSPFSGATFPAKTKTVQNKLQSRFASDVMKRCNGEMAALSKIHKGNIEKMVQQASYLAETIIQCYSGDCSKCHKHSFVCTAMKPWGRPDLPNIYQQERQFLTLNAADKALLIEILNKRFGRKAVLKTKLNTTQNKCEGVNRGLLTSLPKHLTYSRQYPARAHAAVHRMNNLPGASLLELQKAAGCQTITHHSPVNRQLQQRDKTVKNDKRKKASLKYKSRRSQMIKKRYLLYDEKHAEMCYSSKLDVKSSSHKYNMRKRISGDQRISGDHSYAFTDEVRKRIFTGEHSYNATPKQRKATVTKTKTV